MAADFSGCVSTPSGKLFSPRRFVAGWRHWRRTCRERREKEVLLRTLKADPCWEISRQRLRAFKGRHAGERCFIVGNGPSLKRMNLGLLRNEITFGMNRVYLLFPELGFQTTYFVSINALVIEQCAEEIAALKMPKFLSAAASKTISFDEQTMFMNSIGGEPDFSRDVVECVWESGTVTYVALQLACYMGFGTVVLIGVDHNFATKGPANELVVSEGKDMDHFDPRYFGKGFRWQLPDLYHSEMGYRLARDVYAAEGREIVDATVGGKLDIFPKVKFDDLFPGRPSSAVSQGGGA